MIVPVAQLCVVWHMQLFWPGGSCSSQLQARSTRAQADTN